MTRTRICRTCKGAGETEGEACFPCFGAGMLEVWTYPERKEAEGVEQLELLED